MIKHLFITFLFCFFLNITAFSQTTYAVIVGVSDYANLTPSNGDLRYADDDAKLFASLLQSRDGGMVPSQNIILLTEHNATRDNILKAIQLYRYAKPKDRIIFFFSGHGDQGVLLPYDVKSGVIIMHNDIKREFRKSAAQTKLLLVDACKSGSIRRQTLTHAPTQTTSDMNRNVVVMMSSRSNQLSQELSSIKHGAFTYYLVKGAAGPADFNENKIITIQELYQYMRGMIQGITRNQQTPVVYGRFPATMPFTYVNR